MGVKQLKDKMAEVKLKHLARRDKRTEIQKEIDAIMQSMQDYKPWSDEYTAAIDNLKKLAEAQAEMDEADAKKNPKSARDKLSVNTIITAVTSLLTVGGILWAESEGGLGLILRSKAMQFIPKSGNGKK